MATRSALECLVVVCAGLARLAEVPGQPTALAGAVVCLPCRTWAPSRSQPSRGHGTLPSARPCLAPGSPCWPGALAWVRLLAGNGRPHPSHRSNALTIADVAVSRLWALHARRIASRAGKMHVQVFGVQRRQEPLNRLFEIAPIDELGARHHALRIEGAHGKDASPELLGNLVHFVVGLLPATNKDGKAHAVGRVDGQMLVVEQNQLIARL